MKIKVIEESSNQQTIHIFNQKKLKDILTEYIDVSEHSSLRLAVKDNDYYIYYTRKRM